MEQAVLYSLDNGFLHSAVFLSEQLYYVDKLNDNSRFLHGLCLLRSRQTNKAHLICQAIKHLGCAYIYARTCLVLKKYKAGITALLSVQQYWHSTSHFYNHTESTRRLLPDAAAVNCLLGQLYQADNDAKRATEHLVNAARANPYLWEAFEGLLKLGVEMTVKNVFRPSDALNSARSMFDAAGATTTDDLMSDLQTTPDIFNQLPKGNEAKNYMFRPTLPLTRLDEFDTPNGPATPTMGSDQHRSSLETLASTTIQAPTRNKQKPKLPELSAPKFGLSRVTAETVNGSHYRAGVKDESLATSSGQRRSSRLNLPSIRPSNRNGPVKKTSRFVQNGKTASTKPPAESIPIAKGRSETRASTSPINLPSLEAESTLLRLLSRIGEGYYALSKYQCQRSIDHFQDLEIGNRTTPTILAKLGRAYYEHGNYEDAALCYKDLRRIDPARIDDMELYSTCLWHLRRDIELSYLAHEIVDLDRLSPQAWCILANCFSLQREHDQALKCVGRAIQLDKDFAYAHTLEGHEYAANEEFERAQASFRNAIRADKRHYNAWYGLGMAYMKTGDNDQAEFHFVKAAQINPSNAVLVCCIGIVMERSKRWPEALQQYERACQLAPQNALARFKKAKALIMARDYKSAMNDLHILKELAPDEANVHYLLGKMYRQFGDKTSAMKHLTIAMNLDNKASHLVKEAIENMDELDNSMAQ
ncbi:Anaphase-promoting complex subunit 3 [Taphrina deformans PYCC 5710]|uniref:Anaphase-promoting complex subunit 3 n=1 Tax=Taphrina deformans (strain PYCC 5710 / ATCC 11124 / CBS 356.35 / IMI 108563 / JCM 9778 / NBRC 8474) TaxID=1097556 RepID=R4XDG6_TAPDE|nr:Anaphase-promoting complex subunit 3 [Taphrina deformans PYCC 5710]|eukprot:CCG81389.1 Anaphase-promoting complex subunit 3 [Taphrina deformans PYCC 5710]